MVEESTRRLPIWMTGVTTGAAVGADGERKRKKTDPPTSTRKNNEIQSDTDEEFSNKKKKDGVGRKRSSSPAELTVEDLVSIAEEHVKAEEDPNQNWSLHGQLESQTQLRSTAFSRNDLQGSLFSPDDEQTSSPAEITASCGSTVSLVSDQSPMTGNPAQDMLDLFLGPLLKKPIK